MISNNYNVYFIAWIGSRAAVYRFRTAKRTDRRVRIMNEIIQAIQVIKMYTWEKSFANMVDSIRKYIYSFKILILTNSCT